GPSTRASKPPPSGRPGCRPGSTRTATSTSRAASTTRTGTWRSARSSSAWTSRASSTTRTSTTRSASSGATRRRGRRRSSMSWEMPGVRGKPYIVDCHAHISPPRWAEAHTAARQTNLDMVFRNQDAAGVDLTVFGQPWWSALPPDRTPIDAIRELDDFAAELTARHADRVLMLASTNPYLGDPFLQELERAVQQLGLRGVMVGSTIEREYLDSPRAEPFWELVTRLDIPVFIHPPRSTIGDERMEFYRLPEMVGRPVDTTLSLTRLILTGVLERHPTLKLVCA